MFKRMVIMMVLCALVLGGVFGYKMFVGKMMMKYMAAGKNPPQTVSTAKAVISDWQAAYKAVGSMRAVKGADLAPEVAGIVENIKFESGDDVEEGATIIHLRDADDEAKLRALKAAERLAEITLERDEKQLKAQAVSQATVDTDRANLDAAKAQVDQQQAVLNKKTIKAPFAGRIGVRNVDVGQYLNAGTAVVTLQQLDPIYIDFYLPQQVLKNVRKGQKVTLTTDTWGDKAFDGEISAINAKVDQATRNVLIRAAFKNPEKQLLPGMFASASIAYGDAAKKLTIPQTAITFNPYGNTVYLVDHTQENGKDVLKAKQTFVMTGETRGDQIVIESGLKEGDEVVSAGQVKLRNGSLLVINNAIQPTNDENPKPQEQ